MINEAPHITVGKKVIDLEFEVSKLEGLKKIIKVLLNQPISDKYGTTIHLKTNSEIAEFKKNLIKNAQVKRELEI